eukprot:9385252-Heterocapsa_arctica.AAC.1
MSVYCDGSLGAAVGRLEIRLLPPDAEARRLAGQPAGQPDNYSARSLPVRGRDLADRSGAHYDMIISL